ncbi:MAG: aminotransferase class V-fold PLP-dependent enzyme [Candidatus Glassbacteria bacterium]|nr:aminotransferase class V-fold PLP-dependent enzyme [Candidatus Glassbacteria bacterium]
MPDKFAQIREKFPITANRVYLNNAAVAPVPPFITEEAKKIFDGYSAVGGELEGQWHRRIAEIRKLVAGLMGCGHGEIFFSKNTSEGLTFAVRGFPWREGDNALSLRGEFPAVTVPLNLLGGLGVELRIVEPRPDNTFSLDDLIAAMDSRTRMLVVSFVEFHTGTRNDMIALGELCRKRGLFFAVDGVQGVGSLVTRVRDWQADLVSVGGHKWMIAGEGVGFCYLNRDKLELLDPVGASWLSLDDPLTFLTGSADPAPFDKPLAPDAGRFEGGTLNIAGIHTLGKSVETMLELGPENIEAHVLGLGSLLVGGLVERGFEVLSPQSSGARSGITCFRPRNEDAKELLRRLRGKKFGLGFPCASIRVSPHYYNNEDDIERLLAALD